MVPDGPYGRQSAEFQVLGRTLVGGDGAAFLAHAAGCNTAWHTFVRNGDQFAPVVEPGPTREKGETFSAFSERLHAFYAKKIEEAFTGDPRNIRVTGHWMQGLAGAQGQRRESARHLAEERRKAAAPPTGLDRTATPVAKAAKQLGGGLRPSDANPADADARRLRLARAAPCVKNRSVTGIIGDVIALTKSLLTRWRKPVDHPARDKMRSGIRQSPGRRRHAMRKRANKSARNAHE
jgi:hypothetical protein